MEKANQDIREYAKKNGVFHWQIGDKFGVNDVSFSRWMRHEFSPEKKAQALRYIDEIVREKNV